MTLASDIADDYTIFDGVETVTLTPAGGSAVTGVAALRGPTLTAPQGGEALQVDSGTASQWELFVATLGSTVPAPGDTITDASNVVWRIRQATLLTLGSRYQCVAVLAV